MTHWGWYWKVKKKHQAKNLVSQFTSIDSFSLYSNHSMAGFIVKPLGVKADPTPQQLIITYKQSSYSIPIDKVRCNYGGFRFYFLCPLCKKRMRFLYFAQQSLFLCRACLRLAYFSQRLRPTDRYTYMSCKISDLIKSNGGDVDLNLKPPHMHRNSYQKLRSKRFEYEYKAENALKKDLLQWYGPKKTAKFM